MKKKYSQLIILAALTSLLGACASLSRLNSAVFNDNKSKLVEAQPSRLMPPKSIAEGDLVDEVYQRSQADYHYSLGEALSFEGDSHRAIEEFKLTLVYDTKSVEVRLRLASEFVKQGLLSEAIEQAEAAVEIDAKSLDGRLLLGGLYSSMKLYDVAMKQYEFLKIEYPDNLDVPIYIGALLAEQEKFDESEAVFTQLAKNPANKNPQKAYYYIGRIRTEQGNKKLFPAAEQAFLKSVSLDPEDEDVVLALAGLYEQMGKPDKGFKLLTSFEEKFGPKKEVARTLSLKYLEKEKYDQALDQLEIVESFESDNLNVKVKIALILIEQKKYDNAVEKLEEIIRTAPESDKIRFYLGAVYEETKKPESAIEHFSKITPASSYYTEAVVHSAFLYKSMGKIKQAVDVIEDAIKQKDDVPQFYAFFASLLDDSKQYDKAISMLETATKKFADNAQLEFFLGSMYDRKGKADKTIEAMRKVLTIDENHIQAMNYLAYTFAEKGINLDEAKGLAQKALGLSPDDGYILDTMGWVLFRQGQTEDAIKYLEAAHKNVSNESIIAEHLGDAYYRFELLDKARTMYTKAVLNAEDEERAREIKTKISTIDQQKDLRRPASNAAEAPAKSDTK